jgi:hypothetical protein
MFVESFVMLILRHYFDLDYDYFYYFYYFDCDAHSSPFYFILFYLNYNLFDLFFILLIK